MSKEIGLIAGSGKLPFYFSKSAQSSGKKVFAVAIKGEAAPSLERHVDEIVWIHVGQLGRLIKQFKRWPVKKAYMQGKVRHRLLFSDVKPDLKAISLLARLPERSGSTIMSAVVGELGKAGIKFGDCRDHLEVCLTEKGLLAAKKPPIKVLNDIRLGRRLAEQLSVHNVGQTVVVKDSAVVALEAMEGTDSAIRRASDIAGRGVTVVKLAGRKHDFRFDVPTVGMNTLRLLLKAKASALALEAGRTFIIEKERFLSQASASGLAVIAF